MISLFYVVLALVGLICAGVTYWKSEYKAELLVLFAFSTAVILFADWIAYGILGLYDYSPGLSSPHIADSALGEFLAEAIFVPSLVVTLVSLLPGLTGIVVGTVIVSGLEVLVTWLGLYDCEGWFLGLTIVGFAVYLAALDLFWHDMTHGTYPWDRVRLFLRGALAFDSLALLTLFLRAQQWVVTNIHVMPTYIGNQSLGRLITYALIAGLCSYWVLCGQGSGRWVRFAVVMAGLFAFNIALEFFNIQKFVPPYSRTADVLAQGAAIVLAALAEDGIVSLRERQYRRLA